MSTKGHENSEGNGDIRAAGSTTGGRNTAAVTIDEADSGTPVLRVSGDIDMFANDKLQTAINDALTGGPAAVILDLTGVTFLDSAGLSALITAQIRHPDTHVRVVAASAYTLRPIQLTGLDQVLDIYPTLQAARQA
ncbi:STAS domain-containing protein [Fodinicola acaciae]|uniref:STAS domain-containing protein n=1 Tax=Fodinicola acaciae TaxID=2681555 RepID=UPI0013D8292C|nr:STAS domain-containing protein [Fodinicola acaciae]